MGVAILLGGCQGLAPGEPVQAHIDSGPYPDPLTPEQFESLVGTVSGTRAKVSQIAGASQDFMRRFVSFSPRILAAKRPGGVIGSVLVDPAPTAV